MNFKTIDKFKIINFGMILIGVILRLYLYFLNRSFWLDECNLANNLDLPFKSLAYNLDFNQSAPFLFLVFSKVMFLFFNSYSELALRFLPLIASILGLFLFYFILKDVIKNKIILTILNFLFIFNEKLIYYSQEFKQYGFDVFIVLGLIYLFSKIKIEELSKKRLVLLSIFLVFLPFLSLASCFVLGGYFILSLKKDFKKALFCFFPSILIFGFYFIKILLPLKEKMIENYSYLWSDGFLGINLIQNLEIYKQTSSFYFMQDKFFLFGLILFFIGIFILIKQKTKITNLIVLTFLMSVLTSFLHIYPIKERVSLYLIPLLLIIYGAFSNLDLNKHKKLFTFCLVLFLTFFLNYNFSYFYKTYFKKEIIEKCKKENPRELMKYLKENYDKKDWIIFNDASEAEFLFYSERYDLKNIKFGKISLSSYGKDWYFSVLKEITKNKKGEICWFYYSNDYKNRPVIDFLIQYLKNNTKILEELKIDNSYLFKVRI